MATSQCLKSMTVLQIHLTFAFAVKPPMLTSACLLHLNEWHCKHVLACCVRSLMFWFELMGLSSFVGGEYLTLEKKKVVQSCGCGPWVNAWLHLMGRAKTMEIVGHGDYW